MNNYRNQAIDAAFYANPELLRRLIDEGNFPTALIEDIGILNAPFPIWRIPQCWEIAMGTDISIYLDEVKNEVADFMERNAKVKSIFAEAFSVEYSPIDYQQYHMNFYEYAPDDTDDDIIMEDNMAEIYKYGTRNIDLELYCAVCRFDFLKVKELLDAGADPYAPALCDASDNSIGRMGDECSFLCTCQLSWAWKPKRHYQVDRMIIGDLVAWAAHETMYKWIEKYTTIHEDLLFDPDYVFMEEMHAGSVKAYRIAGDGSNRDLLVLDRSRAWFIELPSRELNLDNYSVCVSGSDKDFKALFGVESLKDLVDASSKEYCRIDAMNAFLKRINGRKGFKVNDYRIAEHSTKLDKFIHGMAQKRGKVPQRYFMDWYQGVSKHLLAAGLSEAKVIDLLEKHPLQVGYLYAHDGWGLTPDIISKRLLTLRNK